MRARKRERWPNVSFAHELVDMNGQPYTPTRLTHEHEAVRALASGLVFALQDAAEYVGRILWPDVVPPARRNPPFTPIASIWSKRFQDLRDTAVTDMFEAGCDIAKIATITGHSLKTVQEILDKHYFVRHAGLAIDAGKLLDAHRRKA